MAITDTGFRKREGKLGSPLTRWLVIARTGISLEMKKKSVRRIIMFSWAPILYVSLCFLLISFIAKGDASTPLFIGLRFILLIFDLPMDIFDSISKNPELVQEGIWSAIFYGYMSSTQMIFSVLIVGIVGPSLICNDQKGNSFLMYFSRPILPFEYLLGKFSIVFFFIMSVTLVPSLILYTMSIGMSQDVNVLKTTFPVLIKIVSSALIIAVPFSVMILFFSSLFKQSRFPMILWFTLMFIGYVSGVIMRDSGMDQIANLVSFPFNMSNLIGGLFDVPGSFGSEVDVDALAKIYDEHRTPLKVSSYSLLGVVFFCFFFLLHKIKAPLRI